MIVWKLKAVTRCNLGGGYTLLFGMREYSYYQQRQHRWRHDQSRLLRRFKLFIFSPNTSTLRCVYWSPRVSPRLALLFLETIYLTTRSLRVCLPTLPLLNFDGSQLIVKCNQFQLLTEEVIRSYARRLLAMSECLIPVHLLPSLMCTSLDVPSMAETIPESHPRPTIAGWEELCLHQFSSSGGKNAVQVTWCCGVTSRVL